MGVLKDLGITKKKAERKIERNAGYYRIYLDEDGVSDEMLVDILLQDFAPLGIERRKRYLFIVPVTPETTDMLRKIGEEWGFKMEMECKNVFHSETVKRK